MRAPLLVLLVVASASGTTSVLIVDHAPSGSCYGPCFPRPHVGPPDCPHACDFASVWRGSDQESQATMVMRFMDTSVAYPFDPRSRPDQLMSLFVQESPLHYPSTLRDSTYMAAFNYSYTFHPESTWYSGTSKYLSMVQECLEGTGGPPPVSFAEKRSKWAMMSAWVSNAGVTTNARRQYLQQLVGEGVSVASYGRCDHNAETWVDGDLCRNETAGVCPWWVAHCFNWGAWAATKIWTSAQHLFLWAAENSDYPHYHSEKVYMGLGIGVVPVVMGSRTIRHYVPSHSIIHVSDFRSPRELAAYLKRLASNETEYNEYLAWRGRPLEPHVLSELSRGSYFPDEFQCDVCTTAHLRPPSVLKPF